MRSVLGAVLLGAVVRSSFGVILIWCGPFWCGPLFCAVRVGAVRYFARSVLVRSVLVRSVLFGAPLLRHGGVSLLDGGYKGEVEG